MCLYEHAAYVSQWLLTGAGNRNSAIPQSCVHMDSMRGVFELPITCVPVRVTHLISPVKAPLAAL